MMYYGGGGAHNQHEELSDEEECGDTDEHIIHSAANFNPSGMMSSAASAGGAPSNGNGVGAPETSMHQ